jgi:protocatechuate 3,4-dioxygenase beta subunit
MRRRNLLKLLAGAGALTLVSCASSSRSASTSTTNAGTTNAGTTASGGNDTPIPEETAGPFPGDGSNGPDVLSEPGVVRRDITSSIGSASGVAEGVPTTIKLTILDTGNASAALAGAAVYVWHCDREGRYSMYSDGATGENYLRGVQAAGDDGIVTFQSIFPACYPGRWPHIHFEVYRSVDDATNGGEKLATSQLAIPGDVCNAAFAADGYEQSIQHLAQISLTTDIVFSDDGAVHELATVTGSVDGGYVLALTVPV